jgi:arylsulfatase A-like enzyme
VRNHPDIRLLALAAVLGCGGADPGATHTPPRTVTTPQADPPSCSDVHISPASPFEIDDLTCSWRFTDPEHGPDLSTVSWDVGGTHFTGPVLLRGQFAAGDVVSCTVTPSDGARSGTPAVGSATIGVAPIPGNILIFLADDVGVDAIGLYGLGSAPAPTPNLDELAASGVLFSHATADDLCSPTRAEIQTGRYGWRTGIGGALASDTPWGLQYDETTLPEMLAPAQYDASYVGKWHLGVKSLDLADHPNLSGWPWFAGILTGVDVASDGLPQSYYNWEETTNGVAARVDEYMTTVHADRAIDRIAAMHEPWILQVGWYAAHLPLVDPPGELVSGPKTGGTQLIKQFNQTIEAMDTEMGRVLASIPPDVAARTTVIFLGDNGTYEAAISPPLDPLQGKATPYEGGSHVPLVISGPLVAAPGTTSEALVDATDLYATIAELGGVAVPDPEERDTISLLPYLRDPTLPSLRQYSNTDWFLPTGPPPYKKGWHTIRDERWKLIDYVDGTQEFYDLDGLEYEAEDLLAGPLTPEQQVAHDRLEAELPAAFR